MRNVLLEAVDGQGRDVLPIATDYSPGTVLDWHDHRRAQLLYAATGTMQVETGDGAWTVPGERAVLIPPRTPHRVRMLDVQTNSLYIEPGVVPWWPMRCRVIEVGPLLRELLLAAPELEYVGERRSDALLALLLLELEAARESPLHLPLPGSAPLAELCRGYLAEPNVRVSNAQWARAAVMGERAFAREFRAATGMSPAAWRSRARLLAAVPILRHQNVTEVSALLGYASPAAFSYAFSRALGTPPTVFRPLRGAH